VESLVLMSSSRQILRDGLGRQFHIEDNEAAEEEVGDRAKEKVKPTTMGERRKKFKFQQPIHQAYV